MFKKKENKEKPVYEPLKPGERRSLWRALRETTWSQFIETYVNMMLPFVVLMVGMIIALLVIYGFLMLFFK